MQQLNTKAIFLSRTNFGEADRIITALTSDYGKVRLMARGVRRAKAKLAGAIELFGISDITFIKGRGEIDTLISARLNVSFLNIIKSIERVNLGYEILKIINKNTEDEVENDYFELMAASLAALDDASLPLEITELYFEANLLKLAGHALNLDYDSTGNPLEASLKYNFSASDGLFASSGGDYGSSEIKFLRLVFSGNSAKSLNRITNAKLLASATQPLLSTMLRQYLRVSP